MRSVPRRGGPSSWQVSAGETPLPGGPKLLVAAEGRVDPREPGLVVELLAPAPLRVDDRRKREVVRVRGPLAVATVAPQVADVLEALDRGRMVLAEALGPDRERAVVQGLGLVVAPDQVIAGGQDVE